MVFKKMVTVAAVIVAAGAGCGCSSVSPNLQAQNAYGAVGRAGANRAYATSPTVEVPGERIVGADPDLNVRFELNREAASYLHGGN